MKFFDQLPEPSHPAFTDVSVGAARKAWDGDVTGVWAVL